MSTDALRERLRELLDKYADAEVTLANGRVLTSDKLRDRVRQARAAIEALFREQAEQVERLRRDGSDRTEALQDIRAELGLEWPGEVVDDAITVIRALRRCAEAAERAVERLRRELGADTGRDCVYCTTRIYGTMVGAGDGFAHRACYCPDCGARHQVVRPGKTQPTCDCHETCHIHGRNKVVYHPPGVVPNVSGYFCLECIKT